MKNAIHGDKNNKRTKIQIRKNKGKNKGRKNKGKSFVNLKTNLYRFFGGRFFEFEEFARFKFEHIRNKI